MCVYIYIYIEREREDPHPGPCVTPANPRCARLGTPSDRGRMSRETDQTKTRTGRPWHRQDTQLTHGMNINK